MSIQQMLISGNTGTSTESYWTNTITNSNGNVTLFGQAFDSEGNIYVCGEVLQSQNEGVIYKLDKNGTLMKSVQLSSTNGLSFNAIVIDSSDDVYVYAGYGRIGKYNSNLDLQYFKKNNWGNGNQFDYGDTIKNGNSMTISGTTLTVAGRSSTFGVYATFETTTGIIQTKYYAYLNSGTVNYQGGGIVNGQIYLCGYDINPTYTNGNAYWVVSINGNSNTYRFYQSGTSGAARCIVRDSNGSYYIGGNMGGYPMITKVASYNETNTNQGTAWWRRGNNPGPAYNDLALDSQDNVYGVTGTYNGASGHLIKIDPSGNVLWSREFTAGDSINKITIDSDDNIWLNINKNQNNNSGVSIIARLTSDGHGAGYCNYSIGSYAHSSFSYALQDFGNIQYNWWNSTQDGSAIWGGLVSSDPSKTASTITPSDNECEIEDVIGQTTFIETGTHTWICPPGVYQVSAVCVGGGGAGNGDNQSGSGGAAGGGGLGWKNNISVTPGQSYTLEVGSAANGGSGNDGGDSYFINATTVQGRGGQGSTNTQGQPGGGYVGDGGGYGGAGGAGGSTYEGGGGGAGGYTGNGGNGGFGNGSTHPSSTPLADRQGQDGSGGGGGGGGYGGGYTGGGTGILGAGSPGLGAAYSPPAGVPFGSGTAGSGGSGTSFGGGGSGAGAQGGSGAVRIIWGRGRSYPNTNTGNVNDRVGQQEYTAAGTYSWICPTGVHHVSVVAVGAGGASSGYNAFSGSYEEGNGGGGGGLGYNNYIPVIPGQSYNVVVGTAGQVQTLPSSAGGSKTNSSGDSYFINTSTVKGGAGENALPGPGGNGSGGTYSAFGDGGGNGGNGGSGDATYGPGGGGGAAGYTGNGGSGGGGSTTSNAVGGSGGGAGGGAHGYINSTNFTNAAGGGGVGLQEKGSNGAGGSIDNGALQQEYTSAGTFTWYAPAGVTSVCAVCVGAGGNETTAGGDGGGGLGWKNNIPVVPGQGYTVVVGAQGTGGANGQDSYFLDYNTVRGEGGTIGTNQNGGTGGGYVGDGGGNGGDGGSANGNRGGGGGAGGYSGNGGMGGTGISFGASYGNQGNGGAGGGGAGASWEGGAGGGAGLLGEGTDGAGAGTYDGQGSQAYGHCGKGGSGAAPQTFASFPGLGPGSGGGGGNGISGNRGAVRLIWGTGRAFPSTNTADQFDTATIGHGGGGSGGASFGTGVGISSIMEGGLHGGGSGGASNQTVNGGVSDGVSGSDGGVRIIWGYNRSFPQNNTVTGENGEPTQGAEEFTTAGTFSWTAPDNVTSVCVIAIGGGGGGAGAYDGTQDNARGAGGGGGLGYKNNISVTPGQSYTVVVGEGGSGGQSGPNSAQLSRGGDGGDSYFIDTSTVKGGRGYGGDGQGQGGDFVGENDGVGNSSNYGGRNGGYGELNVGNGGAGAAGYSGCGAGDGRGVTGASGGGSGKGNSANGSGGLIYSSSGGGGTGIYGEGATGSNGTNVTPPGRAGGGGSGGENGEEGTAGNYQGKDGGKYGGGGGVGSMQIFAPGVTYGGSGGDGGVGAVRIIWGPGRAFPNYNAGDI